MRRRHQRILGMVAAMALANVVQAGNIYWLGDQNNPPYSIEYGAPFTAGGYWFNLIPPSSSDSAEFGYSDLVALNPSNGNTSYAPHIVHFGNYTIVNPITNAQTFFAGGARSIFSFDVGSGDYTFDFAGGFSNNPNDNLGSIGSLTTTATISQASNTIGRTLNNVARSGSLTILHGTLTSTSNLVLGSGLNSSGTLIVSGSDATLTSPSSVLIGQGGGAGTLEVINGGHLLAASIGDSFTFGPQGQPNSQSILAGGKGSTIDGLSNVENGLLFAVDSASLITHGNAFVAKSQSAFIVVGSGATWTGISQLTLGGSSSANTSGQATLDIELGGQVTADTVVVGDGADAGLAHSSGAITISDSGSKLITSYMMMGLNSSGNSSLHVTSSGALQEQAGQSGLLIMGSGYGGVTNSSAASGSQSVTFDSGATVNLTGGIGLGPSGTQASTLLIDGSTTHVNASISLQPVDHGIAVATIRNGAQVDGGEEEFFVGSGSNTTATMLIKDPGTNVQSNGEFLEYSGQTTISNGAHISSGTNNSSTGSALVIGDFNNASPSDADTAPATVLVTTSGSWSCNGNLAVGYGKRTPTSGSPSAGELDITQAGLVDVSNNAYIGRFAQAKGIVNVADANSKLAVAGSLYLGGNESSVSGSTGTLTLSNGGVVSVATKLMIYPGSHVNVTGGKGVVGSGSLPSTNGKLVVTSGGTLAGGGTIIGDVINSGGTVAPADDPETLTIEGDYSQTSGILKLLVNGSAPGEYDQLNVTGVLTLGGSLEIDFAPGFAPAPNTEFDFFRAGSIAPGSSFDALSLPNSVQWDTSSLLSAGSATVVPEPALLAIFVVSGSTLIRRPRSSRVV